ncbi:hypothetical protein [Macrococcus sp. DPC7161]|uniref:hypothetical protein n=1 Tax=Macrococcus sp. DPC7161 TaxID=2507060 RepID=UPI00100AA0BC|nr:hypothetical protein [Macrococcus sp. DPC7161]RXK19080.1 hypothetical protein ER639_01840 [Macrococcus sp. DPC7161]
MLQYISNEAYQKLYKKFKKRDWQQLTSKRYKDKIFYTLKGDKYLTLDNCADEVYIEEFDSIRELKKFYNESYQLELF